MPDIYYRDDSITIYHGDALHTLMALPSNSVHCIVTSPPYYNLRSYLPSVVRLKPELEPEQQAVILSMLAQRGIHSTDPGMHIGNLVLFRQEDIPSDLHDHFMLAEFGNETTPQEYVARLVEIFREARRVLRHDGVAWLNLGDSYATNRSYQVAPAKWKTLDFGASNAQKVPDGLKPKDLIGIPWRVALALQDDGWWLRADVIWSKANPMPESVTSRPTRSHEYVFLLAKSERYFYDHEAIKELSVADHGSGNGFKRPARLSYNGRGSDQPWETQETRNSRTVWEINSRPFKGAHIAVMAPGLARRCILAGSSPQVCEHCGAPWQRVLGEPKPDRERPQARRALEIWQKSGLTDDHLAAIRACGMADAGKTRQTMTGAGKNDLRMQQLADEAKKALGGYYREFLFGPRQTTGWCPTCTCPNGEGTGRSVILDMFAGSGTTGDVARKAGREAILIELNADYCEMIQERFAQHMLPLFGGNE